MIYRTKPVFTYDRDSQFAQALLTLLRYRVGDLPGNIQADLLALGTKHHRLGTPQAQATIKALLNLHPVLVQSLDTESMQALSFLPIYFWAAEDTGTSGSLRARILDWKAQLGVGSAAIPTCLRALNITYALRDEASPEDLRSLASFWQDENEDAVWTKAYTLEDHELARWCELTARLGLFHEHLASIGIKEHTPQGKPAWHVRWSQCVGEALGSMTFEQQGLCIKHWASSDLSDVNTLRACKHADVQAWLLPDVRDLLMPLLPQSELMRWRMLPWAQTKEDSPARAAYMGEQNQAILRMYCPEASRVLDVVSTPEMWCNRKALDASMNRFAKNAPAVERIEDAGSLFDMT